jgi:phage terminase large subunit GpA-like protein
MTQEQIRPSSDEAWAWWESLTHEEKRRVVQWGNQNNVRPPDFAGGQIEWAYRHYPRAEPQ